MTVTSSKSLETVGWVGVFAFFCFRNCYSTVEMEAQSHIYRNGDRECMVEHSVVIANVLKHNVFAQEKITDSHFWIF